MEADFGKRPAPASSSTATGPDRTESAGKEGNNEENAMSSTSNPSHSRTQEPHTRQQQETARIPSSSHDTHPPHSAPSLNVPGVAHDPMLSQSLGMYASGQNFSPQFFPPMGTSSTGYSLHQPALMNGDGGNVDDDWSAPLEVAQQGLSSTGATTPRTLWQLLASFPQQGSLLPSYATDADFGEGSDSNLPQFPLLGAHQHALQSSHLPSNYQHQQQHQPAFAQPVGNIPNDFLPYNPPSAGQNGAGMRHHGNATAANPTQDHGSEVGKSPLAGPASATPSMGGLMKAITNQIGYLEGDESKPYLKLHYFRVAGSTSVHPGINRICLKLRLKPDNLSDLASPANGPHSTSSQQPMAGPSTHQGQPGANHPPSPYAAIAFDEADMPPREVYEPLLQVFFDSLAQHFPSIQPLRLQNRLADGTMSAFLLNSVCAISARFASSDKAYHANAGDVFSEKAMQLLVPALRLPTTDAVTSLLLLSQCEFGQNSESGYWHLMGLAIRMAEHLGSYKDAPEIFEDKDHYTRNKLLFWSLFVQDRLLSLSTGRLCTIRDDMLEVPLPVDEDLIPAPLPPGENPQSKPEPFVALVKLMVIAGRISDLLNGNRGATRTLGPPLERDLASRMQTLQTELVQFYNDLPENLVWSTTNFKFWVSEHKGGVFLALHCMANAVLALLYHPALLASPNGADTPMSQGMQRSIKLSLTCARTICECIVFADLGSPISFISTPQITQALYVAGLAFVHEMRTSDFKLGSQGTKQSGSSEAFLHLIDKQNLGVIVNALKKLESAWAGAGVMLYVLQKRAAGFNRAGIDFDKSSEDIPTFVSVPDTGVLRRFTEPGALSGTSSSDFKTLLAGLSAKSPTTGTNDDALAGGAPGSLGDLLSRYSVDDYNIDFLNSADFGLISGGIQHN
ncbi:hypothetical protein QFC22_003543 [Naganishia vaughanmartiniae]|uniref:Uncharacterized protein n=1 Tax=Naganishia vaughanmartiniae TaxID=1424756 RepID=A0ACC2X716_9TREE|nr:hypothetical protein QFC22_003543 [Naganishia vaughanmartiniae]